MAQQSARRGWKNQMYSSCLEHAFMVWFRSANSPRGPQLHRCIRGRTDGSIRLCANLLQKPLALGAASTDEHLPSAHCRSERLPVAPIIIDEISAYTHAQFKRPGEFVGARFQPACQSIDRPFQLKP